MVPSTPHAHARSVAAQVAGGTLPELQARLSDAQAAITAWVNAYDAALAQAETLSTTLDPLLTVADVAAALSCSERFVYDLIASQTLPTVANLGTSKRVRRSDLARFIAGERESPMRTR